MCSKSTTREGTKSSVTNIYLLNKYIILILIEILFKHQQQVVTAVERAKQVTMSELNSIIGVRFTLFAKNTVAVFLLVVKMAAPISNM